VRAADGVLFVVYFKGAGLLMAAAIAFQHIGEQLRETGW
jgi:hypothetical protein